MALYKFIILILILLLLLLIIIIIITARSSLVQYFNCDRSKSKDKIMSHTRHKRWGRVGADRGSGKSSQVWEVSIA